MKTMYKPLSVLLMALILFVGCSTDDENPNPPLIEDGNYKLSGELDSYGYQYSISGSTTGDTSSQFGPEWEGLTITDTVELIAVVSDTIILYKNKLTETSVDTLSEDSSDFLNNLTLDYTDDFLDLCDDLEMLFMMQHLTQSDVTVRSTTVGDTVNLIFEGDFTAHLDSIVGTTGTGADSIVTYHVEMQISETEKYIPFSGTVPPANWPAIQ